MSWWWKGSVLHAALILWISYLCTSGQPRDTCPPDFSMCTDGHCISSSKFCDGNEDCFDASDERHCDFSKCDHESYMKCKNGRCVHNSYICNEENDCGDMSDEKDCENFHLTMPYTNCSKSEWRCLDNMCIPWGRVCDGMEDCFDASDETFGCTAEHQVACDGFQCHNNHCIAIEWRCDKVDDCDDGSDELNCENRTFNPEDCTVDKGLWLCHDAKKCIEQQEVCDNKTQCPDGSDEGSHCLDGENPCKLLNCSHKCMATPTGPQCLCPSGYKLHDNLTCLDIDECLEYGICDHKCKNSQGSYTCYCDKGYYLKDLHSCKIDIHGGEALMLYSSKTSIKGVYLESRIYFPIVAKLRHVVGIAYDGLHIYWTDVQKEQEAIIRSKEDGSEMELLVTSGIGLPEDLAVDWLTGNIYFTDAEKQHIAVCINNGSLCTVLLNEGIHKPRALLLLIAESFIFWSDWGDSPTIARSGMDGSNPILFVSEDLAWPNGLALDYGNERLYWVDAKLLTIESVKLDQSDRRVILKGVIKHPYAIALFEDSLYWSDWTNKEIAACNKFTGKNKTSVVRERKNYIYGVHIYHSSLHTRTENPCEKSHCSDICLLAPSSSYTCACPLHKQLNSDKHTCEETHVRQVLLIAYDQKLMEIHHQTFGKQHLFDLNVHAIRKIGALAYDPITDTAFISDLLQSRIFSLNFRTQTLHALVTNGIGTVEAMDFDYVGNNLYWCDTELNSIEVMSMSTMYRTTIIKLAAERPLDIALVPEEGVMFIAQHGLSKPYIDKVHMDGTGERTKIIYSEIEGPQIALAYDYELHRLFWTDPTRGVIESTSIDGVDRHLFLSDPASPVHLASVGQDLFWTNWDSAVLHWINKYSPTSKPKQINLDLPHEVEKLLLLAVKQVGQLEPHPCQHNNGGCSHLCLLALKHKVCVCPNAMVISPDGHTCVAPHRCHPQEFRCKADNMCIFKVHRCDGKKDCPSGEDEEDCPSQCRNNEFTCSNGQCIDDSLKCDLTPDCSDGSDEWDCPRRGCDPTSQFTCSSGQCIQITQVCNFKEDCFDSSDETDCENSTCAPSHFHCKSGTCIPKHWECDKTPDCPDASDEHPLCPPPACADQKFTCRNGFCIDKTLHCNGVNECGDNSDEMHCANNTAEVVCPEDQFMCKNPASCIPISARCNGTDECPNGDDEMNCNTCEANEYQCTDGQCIPNEWLCDSSSDCADGSDEDSAVCHDVKKFRTARCLEYSCQNGDCVPLEKVCDGTEDCTDHTDEHGKCATSCKDHPCQGVCHATPSGPRCSCNPGYDLMPDHSSCQDIDECKNNPCAGLCQNSPGSYLCICPDSYLLRSDERSCKAKGSPMQIIFSAGNQIRKLTDQFTSLDILYADTGLKVTGLDVDAKKMAVYWSTEQLGTVTKFLLHRGAKANITGIGLPGLIALDWISENVYIVDRSIVQSIKVCNMHVRRCALLAKMDKGIKITSIAVDPINGYLFWAETGHWNFKNPLCQIHKADMSGKGPKTLLSEDLFHVTGITLDMVSRYIYWVDEHSKVLGRAKYDGEEKQIILEKVQRPSGLVLFEGILYWHTVGSGEITMFKPYMESNKINKISLHSYDAELFTILQSARQPEAPNPCAATKCSHLCVLTPHGARCICHNGEFVKLGQNCANVTEPTIFSTQKPLLMQPSHATNSGITITIVLISIIFLILVLTGYYYYQKKHGIHGKLDISMRFANPSFRTPNEDSTVEPETLAPGQHSYSNPFDGAALNATNGKPAGIVREKKRLLPVLKVSSTHSHLEMEDDDSDQEFSHENQNAKLIP